MKPSKEMVQKYQQQQSKLLSNNSELNQEHSPFAKISATNAFYSNLSSNQMNSTKTMGSIIFSSVTNQDHLSHHSQDNYSTQEEVIKNMLKLNNFHGLQFKDLLNMNPYKSTGQPNASAFNLVKKDLYHTNHQLHNSMMSDETFAEDLSDDHHPGLDDEFMSDQEQMSEDEQPLDFSIKSKKDNDENEHKNSLKLSALSTKPTNHSIFSNLNRSSTVDQVDGDYTFARLNSFTNSLTNNSTMFNNSLNTSTDVALSSFYAHQLNPKLNSLNGLNILNNQAANQLINNRNPFTNPLLLGESQSNLINQIHSEPSSPEAGGSSSPEGLSSASSTSSRSSQGYYSGSSVSGGLANLSTNALNQSITPSSIYSTNSMFNQSSTNQFGKSSYLHQTAPPSYASLNFNNSNKSNFTKTGNNQQVRPSVIVSNSCINKPTNQFTSSPRIQDYQFSSDLITDTSEKIVDSIDEHFRLSLGSSYNKMLNNQSTPTKDVSKSSNSFAKKSPSVDDHFNRSLSCSSDNSSTVIESTTSVDDHFAKALGETWFKLKKDSSL